MCTINARLLLSIVPWVVTMLPPGYSAMQNYSIRGTKETEQLKEEEGEEEILLSCHCRGMKRSACHWWIAKEVARMKKKPKGPAPVPPINSAAVSTEDLLELLPDDVVASILSILSSDATAPSDLVNVMITCKRLKGLVASPSVLSNASVGALAVRAKNWSSSSHLFLKMCADAGNLDACYLLGMIQFYCLPGSRAGGAAMLAKAAIGSHAAALFSLAIIQFNGSGGSKDDKNLPAAVALCAKAARLGHVDAIREFGHCVQDGYGVRRNVSEGRKLLVKANAFEVLGAIADNNGRVAFIEAPPDSPEERPQLPRGVCSLLSDYGCRVPAPNPLPANKFLLDWFGEGGKSWARLCSYAGCGRPETRPREFRRCSACEEVIYCSRACQALDWKLGHRRRCVCVGRWGAAAVDEPPLE